MKKVLYTIGLALLAVGCTEDYKDWANPFKNDPEAAKTMTMTINPVATIDLATVTAETIQIFSPTITIDDEATTTFKTKIYGPEEGDEAEFEVASDGSVATDVLEQAVYALYGQRPVQRDIPMDVSGYVKVGGQTFKAIGNTTVSVIPNAPEIEAAYYFTGTLNGWNNSDTTYKLTNDGSDPYENPIFTCRIPAPEDDANVEFKMTPESGLGGDWSKCLGAGDEGKFKYNNEGGNFVIEAVAGAKFYDLTFNMLDQTWEAKALLFDIEQNYYFTGTLNGWNNSDTSYKLTNDGSDPYANPKFTMRIPASDDGSNIEFKLTPESGLGGDWSKCLGAGSTPGTFVYNNEGGNLVIEAVEGAKYYDVTFNMMELTWSYKAIAFNDFIYEIGNESGWSTPHALKSSDAYDGKYQGFYYLDGEFKFKPNKDDWNGDWENDGEGKIADNGGSNMPGVSAGFYRIDVDLAAMTYALKKIEYVSIIGTANGNWDTDTDLTYNKDEGCWEVTCDLNAGEMKFRGNHNWDGDVDLGGSFDNLVHGGSNIAVEAGNYTIKLYISIAGQHKAIVTKN